MAKPIKKLYVIRKLVMATSARDAIAREKFYVVDDCWVDDNWKTSNSNIESNPVRGFRHK